jgi:hypothetical protein
MVEELMLVVRKNGEYIFYEIKTGNNVESCIRQALGSYLNMHFIQGEKMQKNCGCWRASVK